jgi:hypothetical protein
MASGFCLGCRFLSQQLPAAFGQMTRSLQYKLLSALAGMLHDRRIHADLCRAFQWPARITLQNQKPST